MIVEIFLSLFLVWLIRYLITTYMTRRKMPPGPFPYPFIGNIPNMMSDPVHPFNKLAEKYGDIFTVTFPIGNVVVLNTASLVRDARLGRKDDLSGRSPEFAYPLNVIFGNDLNLADFSPAYQFRRRVFKSAMHVFGVGIEQASERTRHAVKTVIQEIDVKNGQPFSPKDLLEASILVQLWEWLTSKKVALDDPTINDLSEMSAIIAKQAVLASLYQLLPFSSYLPTQFNQDIKRAQQIKNDIFPAEFQDHKQTFNQEKNRDLTDSFIFAYENEITKEKEKDIGSIEDIVGLMLDVINAASDTTSSSLAWLFLFMVRNPDVQQKIHEEIDEVVGTDRSPSWTDVNSMPYLQATLCEVQRASGMIVALGSTAIQDTTIAGYHVPKGTCVIVNFSKLHHDDREWPEPEKFKPERFLDRDGKFVGWNKLHGFIPFGLGRRECAGQSLAKITLFTFASVLLHRYKIAAPEGEKMPTTDVFSPALVMCPTDFHVVAKMRN